MSTLEMEKEAESYFQTLSSVSGVTEESPFVEYCDINNRTTISVKLRQQPVFTAIRSDLQIYVTDENNENIKRATATIHLEDAKSIDSHIEYRSSSGRFEHCNALALEGAQSLLPNIEIALSQSL